MCVSFIYYILQSKVFTADIDILFCHSIHCSADMKEPLFSQLQNSEDLNSDTEASRYKTKASSGLNSITGNAVKTQTTKQISASEKLNKPRRQPAAQEATGRQE